MKTLDPKNYPPVPAGFSDPVRGPLIHPSQNWTRDIALLDDRWRDDASWSGEGNRTYSLRLGSPVALANGISAAPPEPDKIERTLAALRAEFDESTIYKTLTIEECKGYEKGLQFAINLLTGKEHE